MEEGVATADLAEQDSLGGIIQEPDIIPRSRTVSDEPETEDDMLEARFASRIQPDDSPNASPKTSPTTSPSDQPDDQPADQPADQPDDQPDEQRIPS